VIDLVVDANPLVSELLRRRGREFLLHPELKLSVSARAWNEAQHELRRRAMAMVRHGHLTDETAVDTVRRAEALVSGRILLVPEAVYGPFESRARLRIRRDPDDWPTVALAMAVGSGIWTNDQDFFGCGLPVWSTETLVAVLA
jgi:predicted nucleic acid-binding protein